MSQKIGGAGKKKMMAWRMRGAGQKSSWNALIMSLFGLQSVYRYRQFVIMTTPLEESTPHALLISLLQSNPAMELGKLTAEYRERPAAEGGPPVRRGPYLKLQGREHGQHFTRRVSADEAVVLQEHVSNFERFTELTAAVVDASVAQGRAQRAELRGMRDQMDPESKKNSTKKPAASGSRKRKPSSPQPRRG
jgi:hypothetical protein